MSFKLSAIPIFMPQIFPDYEIATDINFLNSLKGTNFFQAVKGEVNLIR